PHGYHRLSMAVRGRCPAQGSLRLFASSARCRLPPRYARYWGLSAQLYGLRSARIWGRGGFTDLAALTEPAAGIAGAAVGVRPLPALVPADPNHLGPYSPSSRLFLNVLYLDPEAVPDRAESAAAQALLGDAGFRDELARARAAEMVDYPAVWRLKLR